MFLVNFGKKRENIFINAKKRYEKLQFLTRDLDFIAIKGKI